MLIKINRALAGHAAGTVIDVPSVGSVPTELFWRRRLRDAIQDGCCEIAVQTKESVQNPTVTEEDND